MPKNDQKMTKGEGLQPASGGAQNAEKGAQPASGAAGAILGAQRDKTAQNVAKRAALCFAGAVA